MIDCCNLFKLQARTANPPFLLFLTVAFTFLGLSCIAVFVFDGYPFCMDEYGYLYQARIFGSGRMGLEVPPAAASLAEIHMRYHSGVIFSKYPPGYPAILIFGVLLQIPALINPLLSVGTIFCLYRLLVSITDSLSAVLTLVLVASNSYFLGYGASFFSQPAALFFTTLALYAFFEFRRRPSTRWAAILGLAGGCCILVRPLDGLMISGILVGMVPIVQPLRESWKHFRCAVLPILICVAILYFYSFMQSGQLGVVPYDVWQSDFRVVWGPEPNLWQNLSKTFETYLRQLIPYVQHQLFEELLPHTGWILPGCAVLGVFSLTNKSLRLPIAVVIVYMVGTVLAYNFHDMSWSNGWPQYGARYWYSTLTPLSVLGALGLASVIRILPMPLVIAGVVFGCVSQLKIVVEDLGQYRLRFEYIHAAREAIELACPPGSIVVLKNVYLEESKQGIPRFVNWQDLKRNAFLSGSRFFLLEDDPVEQVIAAYPELSECSFDFKNFSTRYRSLLPKSVK